MNAQCQHAVIYSKWKLQNLEMPFAMSDLAKEINHRSPRIRDCGFQHRARSSWHWQQPAYRLHIQHSTFTKIHFKSTWIESRVNASSLVHARMCSNIVLFASHSCAFQKHETKNSHPPQSRDLMQIDKIELQSRPEMRLQRGKGRLGWVWSEWPQSPHALRCPSCSFSSATEL